MAPFSRASFPILILRTSEQLVLDHIRWSDNYRSGLGTTKCHSNAFVVENMADKGEDGEDKSGNSLSKIKISSCFLHFEGIKGVPVKLQSKGSKKHKRRK